MIGRAALTVTVWLLCACATTTTHDDVLLIDLPLLPSTAEVPADEAVYSVRATQRGVHHDVLVVLSRQGDGFTLRALSEIGLTLFQWPAAAPSPVPIQRVPADVDPDVVVRLMQLSLWPLEEWQQALTGSLWRVSESSAGARMLSHGEYEVVVMTRSADGAITLRACLNAALAHCASDRLQAFVVTPLRVD